MEELSQRGLIKNDRLEAGTLYTLLRRMEHHGLVSSEWVETEGGPDKRVYRITPEGTEFLRSGIESLLKRKYIIDELASYYETNMKPA